MITWGIISACTMFVQGAGELLRRALPARRRRGRLLPRHDPLPLVLVPGARAREGGRVLHVGDRDLLRDRRADLRRDHVGLRRRRRPRATGSGCSSSRRSRPIARRRASCSSTSTTAPRTRRGSRTTRSAGSRGASRARSARACAPSATSVGEAMKDRRVLAFGLLYFCMVVNVYGLSFWVGEIVDNICGLGDVGKGFVTAIPYTVAIVGLVADLAPLGPHGRAQGPSSAVCLAIAAVAFVVSTVVVPVAAIAALAVGLFFLLGAHPVFWTMPAALLSGTAAAAGHRADQLDRQHRRLRRPVPRRPRQGRDRLDRRRPDRARRDPARRLACSRRASRTTRRSSARRARSRASRATAPRRPARRTQPVG